jgi:hypothetical protein
MQGTCHLGADEIHVIYFAETLYIFITKCSCLYLKQVLYLSKNVLQHGFMLGIVMNVNNFSNMDADPFVLVNHLT